MEPLTINVTQLRSKQADFVARVKYGGQRYVVEKNGCPVVVIISWDDFQRVREALNTDSLSTTDTSPPITLVQRTSRKKSANQKESRGFSSQEPTSA